MSNSKKNNGAFRGMTLDDKLRAMNASELRKAERETREILGDDTVNGINGVLAAYGC